MLDIICEIANGYYGNLQISKKYFCIIKNNWKRTISRTLRRPWELALFLFFFCGNPPEIAHDGDSEQIIENSAETVHP